MPRKKNAKRITKRQTAGNKTTAKPFSNIQKMQKEFLQTPMKLAAQLNKDVLALKQDENKLRNALNKAKNQPRRLIKQTNPDSRQLETPMLIQILNFEI